MEDIHNIRVSGVKIELDWSNDQCNQFLKTNSNNIVQVIRWGSTRNPEQGITQLTMHFFSPSDPYEDYELQYNNLNDWNRNAKMYKIFKKRIFTDNSSFWFERFPRSKYRTLEALLRSRFNIGLL